MDTKHNDKNEVKMNDDIKYNNEQKNILFHHKYSDILNAFNSKKIRLIPNISQQYLYCTVFYVPRSDHYAFGNVKTANSFDIKGTKR
ncbi:hypothetical protein CBL_20761 [Carabus blaptoides fortunei]